MGIVVLALLLQLGGLGDSVTVARVIDGDTFVTSDSVRVRLLGVNTPELSSRDTTGRAAKAYMQRSLAGQRVWLEYDPGKRTGYYGRTLAYVYIGGCMVNKDIIRLGHSKPYLKYKFGRRAEFKAMK